MKTPILAGILISAAVAVSACNEAPITPAPALEASFTKRGLDVPTGPFPSDRFTMADPGQQTGRRVHLPLPDCAARPTDCEDVRVLNTLDGFNLQPRLSIPFDGPIDPSSVTSESVFLIELGDPVNARNGAGRKIGINQIVWDPPTTTIHAESDELLQQYTRYALIATRAIRDASGAPIGVTEAFERFRQTERGDYKHALLEAVHAARLAGVREEDIAAASVFTTQSATAILEKIRDQVKAGGAERADFGLGPEGGLTVFNRRDVTGITWNRHLPPPPMPPSTALNIGLLDLHRLPDGQSAVGRIAFGKFRSPDYLSHPGEFIPPVPTGSGVPVVQGWNDIYFNLFLPSGSAPGGGWPVAIVGHGSGGAKDPFGLNVAATMAERGIATVTINAVGHGFGPRSTLAVSLAAGGSVTFLSGGRGIDQNGDGTIGPQEGIDAAAPRTVLRDRDGLRQTVADLMQLVRVIEAGVDVDGDGSRELDPSRIYYAGHSLGGMYGAQFFAVDPSVAAAVLNVPVALQAIRGAWSPVFRASRGTWLNQRSPSLINPPGLAAIGGVPVGTPHYNENLPLRNEPPRLNDVAGAMAIQKAFEDIEWAAMSGDAMAYMPHVRKTPLAGVRLRPALIQFAKGDQNVPNPITSMMLRAGELADVTTYYLHDLARAENGALPTNGHGFMPATGALAFRQIAIGAQRQIATFFASGGATIINPEPQRFFEVPIRLPLPETFNYIR
jgi:hypothetical protein